MNRATHSPLALAVLLAAAAAPGARPAWAGDYEGKPAGPALTDDPLLRELVAAAMDRRPELAAARAQLAAEEERAPQSRVLPDPSLSLGIQNDGFGGIQIGKMESSWVYVVASQTFPWPGKRGSRADLVALDTRNADVEMQRVLLTIAADVERAYVDLLLVRDQLAVLARLESLWQQSEAVARARYETGEGAQSDFLRAQLEKNRLRQKRWALNAEEERRTTVLNRLRCRRMSDPLVTGRTLADLPDPTLVAPDGAIADSLAQSPELKRARLAGEQADRRVDLAHKERWPDVTVSAGVMPRWGNFDTMWQAGVAFNIPVWSVRKQARVIAENQARGQAARSGAEAVSQLIEQRVRERLEALGALVESNRLYRSGLLVQSETTVKSTLAQYQVGRVTFASVLEALSGYLADVNNFLESVAAAQRIAIAEREISLESPGSAGGGGMAGSAVSGAGPVSASASAGRSSGAPSNGETATSSMSRM
jgi:outer membrane protein, heavy metal efflux system